MKKDMKHLLSHIMNLWTYLDSEHEAYTNRYGISADDLDYLYGDLYDYLDTKYKLEESE